MQTKRVVQAVAGALAFAGVVVQADDYQVDPVHSTVAFAIKHLGISEVRGAFTNFTGKINYDPAKPEEFKASGTVEVASINTGNKLRDDHLRSLEFFDAAKLPEIKFETTGIKKDDGEWVVSGKFTLHGVTKEIKLRGELSGPVQDPWGKTRIGLAATTKINRLDYGIIWNKTLDKGGVMIGEEVKISLNIEAVQP
ncbi:MAG: YceI family protein [Kiritimatiellaeota bacterium]|nr:YceI family protein [Kiritimatiellota bacterium]